MRKLNGLDEPLKDLDGKPLLDNFNHPVVVKAIIAQAIRRGNSVDERGMPKFDPIRAEETAFKIYKAEGAIELEDSDYQMAKSVVEQDTFLNVMARAAALRALESPE